MTTIACGTELEHLGPLKPLEAFTSLGCYPILYLTRNNDVLCADCATDERNNGGGNGTVADVYWEGPDMYCDGCNAALESAYGDPDNEDV